MNNDLKKYALIILLILLGFTIILSFFTAVSIPLGSADCVNYWFHAKKLFGDLTYTYHHQSARWGVILPVSIIQSIVGTHPGVYYIIPIFLCLIQVTFLYKICLYLKGINFAFWVSITYLIFPYYLFAHSHLRISSVTATYLLICVFLIMKYYDNYNNDKSVEKKNWILLTLISLTAFMLYLTKAANIFYFPAIALSIYLISKKPKELFYFCLIPGILFIIETILYIKLAGIPLGRYSIISANHVGSFFMQPLFSFWQFIDRFVPPKITPDLLILNILFFLAIIVIIKKRKTIDKRVVLLALFPLIYIFFLTAGFTSLNPPKLLFNFRSRYFMSAVPLMILVVFYVGSTFFKKSSEITRNNFRKKITIYSAVMIVSLIASTIMAYDFQVNKKLKMPGKSFSEVNPHLITPYYYKLLNSSYDNGTPIVTIPDFDHMSHNKIVNKVNRVIKSGLSKKDALKKLKISEGKYNNALKRYGLKPAALGLFKRFILKDENNQYIRKISSEDSYKIHSTSKNTKKLYYIVKNKYYKKDLLTDPDLEIIYIKYKPFYAEKTTLNQLIEF